jgi:hypothetical protein
MPSRTPRNDSSSLLGRELTTPNPDPTVLTTQQLLREIATSREVVEVALEGVRKVFETRLDGMDKAINLIQTASDKLATFISDSVNQLRILHEEKFRSIATQFAERDTRTEQTSRDSKVAVDAALQAAKEAVGEQNKSNALAIAKSETAFTKQIDQIGVQISTQQKGSDDKIDDIKGRLQAIESTKQGMVSQKGDSRDVLLIIVAIAGLALAALAFFFRH